MSPFLCSCTHVFSYFSKVSLLSTWRRGRAAWATSALLSWSHPATAATISSCHPPCLLRPGIWALAEGWAPSCSQCVGLPCFLQERRTPRPHFQILWFSRLGWSSGLNKGTWSSDARAQTNFWEQVYPGAGWFVWHFSIIYWPWEIQSHSPSCKKEGIGAPPSWFDWISKW